MSPIPETDILKSMMKKKYKLVLAPGLLQVIHLEQEADVLLSAQAEYFNSSYSI